MQTRSFHFVLFSILLLAGCAATRPFEPRQFEQTIVPAREWGGDPFEKEAPTHEIGFLTLHHGGVPYPTGRTTAEYLRALQSWSRRDKQWIDIPYHYLIDIEGKVYEGRPLRYVGDTNTEYDPTGHGLVCVIGQYGTVEPNEAQLKTIADTFTWLCWKYRISPSTIRGHRDVSAKTSCPGKNLYKYLQNGYFQQKVEQQLAGMRTPD